MKHRIVLIVVAGALAIVALVAATCRRDANVASGAPPGRPWTPADTTRILAVSTTDTCPLGQPRLGGVWRGERVFPSSATLPGDLRRLCAYTWAPATPGATARREALPAGLGRDIDDPVVVGALGIQDDLRRIEATFLREVDVTSSGPVGLTSIGVADSWPTSNYRPVNPTGLGPVTTGQDPHGFNVAWIARKVSCPAGGDCARQVATQLVLPHPTAAERATYPSTGDVNAYGATSDLARGIVELVDGWKQQPTPRHLVINLSVGWEPEADRSCADPPQVDPEAPAAHPSAARFDGEVLVKQAQGRSRDGAADLVAPTMIVRAALMYAACNGALVIAAAGNKRGTAQAAAVPSCPARWADGQFPSSLCSGFTTSTEKLPESLAFVYAVGAVDDQDAPLRTTRDGGFPTLAAPGFHGVAFPGDTPSPYTRDLSGTSVAAAAVSGIAAAVWDARPSLSAADVMATIRSSGFSLATAATFCDAADCGAARRASRCRAVATASSNAAGVVDLSMCSAAHEEHFLTQDQAQAIHDGVDQRNQHDAAGATALSSDPLAPSDPGARWIYPEPEEPVCPSCFLSIPSSSSPYIYVTINPSYNGAYVPLTSLTFSYYGSAGWLGAYTNLPPGTFTYSTIAIDNVRVPTSVTSATVSFVRADGTRTAPEQIAVIH